MANKKNKSAKRVETPVKKEAVVDKKSTIIEEKVAKTEVKKDENLKDLDALVEAMRTDAKKEVKQVKKTATNSNNWAAIIIMLVLAFLLAFGGYFIFQQYQANQIKTKVLPEVIGLLGGDMKLKEIVSFEDKGGVYKVEFTFEEYAEEPFTSYISKDGKTFFVEGYDVAELKAEMEANPTDPADPNATPAAEVTPTEVSKAAAPVLEAYIVADCPYGTQMQGVMKDAIDAAPEIAKNFQLRYFFDSISDDGKDLMAMHGKAEAEENMRQICIREEQKPLFWDYVGCYASGEKSDACLTSAKIDTAKLTACTTEPARGVKFAKADNALASKHTISGSPTLILNDTDKVSESSFGGRNAQGLKNIVCSSADSALSFCDATLSIDAAPAAGEC